jgi:hypothetical protein
MKKVLFVALLIFAGAVVRVSAQDIILKRDGNEIRAKVTEIGIDNVKYLLFGQDSPVYILPKSEIFRIRYQNGKIEMFELSAIQGGQGGEVVTGVTMSTPVKHKKGYVGLDFGPAFLLKDNHSTTLDQTGIQVNINAGYLFTKHFGVTATYLYTSFKGTDYLEERANVSEFTAGLTGGFIGPLFSFSFSGDKFELDIRPVIGFVREQQDYKSEGQIVEFKTENVLAYGGGPSIRWNVHRFISLSLNVDVYLHEKFRDYNYKFRSSAVTAGVNFRF